MVSKAATVFVPVYPLSAHVVVPLYNLVVTTMFLLLMLCLLSGIQKNFRDYRGLSKQTNWLVAMSIQFGSRYLTKPASLWKAGGGAICLCLQLHRPLCTWHHTCKSCSKITTQQYTHLLLDVYTDTITVILDLPQVYRAASLGKAFHMRLCQSQWLVC